MTRIKLAFIINFIFILPTISKAQVLCNFSDTAVERRIRNDIFSLSSDSMKGREAGTESADKARDYIVNRFMQIGLKPYFTNGSFVNSFAIANEYSEKKAYNIAGYIDNGKPISVVIGAHYDHLGIKENMGSGKKDIFYGADDNASGTAGVLEVALFLKNTENKDFNYVFCAFSGEEEGLLGSDFFTNNNLPKVKYMIDLDMIGRLGSFGDVLFINGTASSKDLKNIISQTKSTYFSIKTIPDGMNGSDDYPFYKKSIPVLFFFTGLHKDYHTIRDVAERINYKGEAAIINYVERLIQKADATNTIRFRWVSGWQSLKSDLFFINMLTETDI